MTKRKGNENLNEAAKDIESSSLGNLFDVSEGPDHHLISVDHEKLKELNIEAKASDTTNREEDLTEIDYDDSLSSPTTGKKIEISEVKADPILVTVLFFTALLVNFVIFAQIGDMGLGGFVARIINY
eukprot:CAMPEP_0184869904 /NCGR_PEP_ID=MMETSP0580-20130426/35744_1 /TAXON_ID=1118495 /ORGANISM="Dactyliosolen fragilissimus" /LENGTH=126 /DNA_ID=CAMNT_0027371703 /DNA_START=150 /DNA_END=527 /DNA_ORIENTATION=-